MMVRAAFGGLLLLAALGGCSGPPPADDWRAMTAEEIAVLDKKTLAKNDWLKAPPKRSVIGDFDQDGRADEAVVRVKGDSFAVFLLPGGKALVRLSEPRPRSELSNFALDILPAGVHQTACGKGYGEAATPCQATVTLTGPGVLDITLESSSSVYFWNGKAFEQAWLSD